MSLKRVCIQSVQVKTTKRSSDFLGKETNPPPPQDNPGSATECGVHYRSVAGTTEASTTESPNTTDSMSNQTAHNYTVPALQIEAHSIKSPIDQTALDYTQKHVAQCYEKCWKFGYRGARYGSYWKCQCYY